MSSELHLKLFDSFAPDQVALLPGKIRRLVIADRKARVTANLMRGLE